MRVSSPGAFQEWSMRRWLNWMVIAGFVLILAGAGNAWLEYRSLHSPLDAVDVPVVEPLLVTRPAEVDAAGFAPEAVGADQASAGSPLEVPGEAARGSVPDRLVIASIHLDAPIVPIQFREITVDGQAYQQWRVPNEFAVGWHDTSALLGLPGNTVLNGHHNAYGMVFENLIRVEEGDLIQVYAGDQSFEYEVVLKLLLPERYQPLSDRLENARWILPSTDERLTLITCWPADSNTHRVVIVAQPVGR
jgi:LPXTG-site transpeptidase (sortase) family protein